jgi:hypothetical protein
MSTKLDDIKQRVEASMCMTYWSAHPDGREEARVSKDDWDAILSMLTPPETVFKAVERILDDHSAWIARPNREVTEKVALAATIAAHVHMTPEVTLQ